MDPKRIAERLKALRGTTPITKMAKATGLTKQALCNYESGYRVPRDETKIIIARYYGKSVQEIFFD